MPCVNRVCPGHVTPLTSVRRNLSQRLDAQNTSAVMFQRGTLTLKELQDIQVHYVYLYGIGLSARYSLTGTVL